MTVTLTTEELDSFQTKLSEWYFKRFEYVVNNIDMWPPHRDLRDARGTFDQMEKLMERFEKENPKPDWRTLL